MPVYWSMLVVALLMALLSYMAAKKEVEQEGVIVYKTKVTYAIFTIGYIIFFVGFRDVVLDTYWYIGSFNETPTELSQIVEYAMSQSSGVGFYLIQGIFKKYISENYYVWLFFLAIVSCIALFRILYKYSVDFPLTAYLFVASSTFTWLLNGTRQFLVVCILFAFTDWLIEGKKLKYIFLAILMTFIHTSAIFSIPICLFISSRKFLGKKMILFALITVIGIYFSEDVIDFLSFGMDKDYSIALISGTGSNILRLFVACIPVFIVVLAYKKINQTAPPSIKLAINMSFVGDCFYLASTFTNGILVGRMPIYFTVYNLYLLPWLIKNCFSKESRKLVWGACVGLYFVYFYYQMHIAWKDLSYISEILHLSY